MTPGGSTGRQRPFGPRGSGPGSPDGKIENLEVDRPLSPQESYAQGFRDGATAQPDRELIAVVEVPLDAVRSGDTIVGEDGEHYHVVRSGRMPESSGVSVDGVPAPGWIVTLVCGTYRDVHTLDHDERVRVLVPVTLADALTVARAGLPGARPIATRGDPGGTFDGDQPWRDEITRELANRPRSAG